MSIVWPDQVCGYLVRTGRDLDYSCPLIEDAAEQKFAALWPVLRDRPVPAALLDIGCGLALIDVHIARRWPHVRVHLLDGDGTAAQDRGFKPTMSAWGDVSAGAAMMRANAPLSPVIIHAPGRFHVPVDLIISSRSWGHHYPISVYADSVLRSLNPGGLLVLDIRTGTPGLSQLAALGFEVVCRIPDPSEKCARFALEYLP
jgi:SAM-dependent methyltransferase